MRRPDYWDSTPPKWALPLSALYALGGRVHRALSRAKKCSVPVISIGNVVAGGAGKTPTAMMLGETLSKAGKHPHFLSRGYGAIVPAPTRVDTKKHTANQVGDEPLLLARIAPCWVFPRRSESAALAVADGADCLVCDDAHQHHALHKDVRLLVIDGEAGFGNGHVHPAGPLREPLEDALARTDAVIFIGEDEHHIILRLPLTMPVFHGDIVPSTEQLPEGDCIAFAGIASPAKFFSSLKKAGVRVVAEHGFNDHHAFTEAELETLLREAKEKNSQLITTEKDWVRLPETMQQQCKTLPIMLQLNQPDNFYAFLHKRI